jgi:hypothetical protein
MRDVHYSTTAGTVTRYLPRCDRYIENVSVQNVTSIRARGRSDIIKSDHLHPTPYRAYEYHLQMGSFTSDPKSKRLWCGGFVYRDEWQEGRPNISVPEVGTHYISTDGGAYVPPRVSAVAKNSVLAQANDIKLNAAQSLAELGSTSRMLTKRFAQGAKALTQFRKGRLKDALRTLGLLKTKRGRKLAKNAPRGRDADLANLWLEYSYGWKPLVSDIMSAHDLIMNTIQKPKLVTVSSVHQEFCPAIPYIQTRYRVKDGGWICGAEASLSYSLASSSVAMLSGMGLTNPLLLAWELLPLSFVVDWFVSVGSFLQGLGAHHGLEFHSGYITEFSRTDSLQIEDTAWPSGSYTGDPPVMFCNGRAMRRTPLYDFPSPGIAFRFGLNINQVASANALLRQRIG